MKHKVIEFIAGLVLVMGVVFTLGLLEKIADLL